jgi:hypothetical protein
MNTISQGASGETLTRVAREQGLDQERLRRWVSFLALCGVLERATHEGILTGYYLKGGVPMELRFAAAARESPSGAWGFRRRRDDLQPQVAETCQFRTGFCAGTFRSLHLRRTY